MTQFNITINLEKLLEDISMSNLNEVSKQMLSIILNNVTDLTAILFFSVDILFIVGVLETHRRYSS